MDLPLMPRAHFARIGHDVSVEAAKRACLDKVRYASRTVARDKAVLIGKRNPTWPVLRPYACTLCGKFHLTSSVPTPGGQILRKRKFP